MSEQPNIENALTFDLADRMRKALRVSGLGVQDLADYLGVTRGTVSTWINGRILPSTQTLRLWAMRTGVPYEWLTEGTVSENGGPGGPITLRLSDHVTGLRIRSHYIHQRAQVHALQQVPA